ncbi:MAG: Ig-like domain-containing protein, partial [Thermoguttaceae bacterium]
TLTVSADGVLANDTDPESDPIWAELVDGPAHGTVSLFEDGSFVYTPDFLFNGTDSFTYYATDDMDDSGVVTVTIDVVTDVELLGTVDFLELEGLDPSSGDLWYRLDTTRAGYLTVEALTDGATLTLYDPSKNEIATSTLINGKQRVEVFADAANEVYHFKLSGGGSDVDVRVTNLVYQDSGQVTVFGTAGDDHFEMVAEASNVGINDVWYDFTGAEAATVTFDGSHGDNTAKIFGTAGIESADLWADRAEIDGDGYTVIIDDVASTEVDGLGGEDSATFYDSAADDEFTAWPGGGLMQSDTISHRVDNFENVVAHATAGGIDVVKFFDSPGNDQYVGTPTYNSLSGDGFQNEVWFFEGSHAYATAGGIDEAKFYDSIGDDTYISTPTYAALFNADYRDDEMANGFYNRVKFFEGVHAFATGGGVDTARFYDSTDNDEFVATPTYAALFNMDYEEQYTSGFYNRAKFFEATHAFGTAGGVDTARLYDSPADDLFYADPTHGALFNPTYQEEYTNGFYNRAKYFEAVHAFATAGGHDTAELHDSSADDTFYADPIQGALYNPTYQESYTNGFYNRAKYFEEVTAFGDTGGRDVALLNGSSENDLFLSDPTGAVLSNPTYQQSYTNGFSNRVRAFDEVYGTAGEGDDDRAYLDDAPGSIDVLNGDVDRARLTNEALDIFYEAAGFDYVKAKATDNGDQNDLPDAGLLQFDLELEGPWQ